MTVRLGCLTVQLLFFNCQTVHRQSVDQRLLESLQRDRPVLANKEDESGLGREVILEAHYQRTEEHKYSEQKTTMMPPAGVPLEIELKVTGLTRTGNLSTPCWTYSKSNRRTRELLVALYCFKRASTGNRTDGALILVLMC